MVAQMVCLSVDRMVARMVKMKAGPMAASTAG
jgi:hypothetical protein